MTDERPPLRDRAHWDQRYIDGDLPWDSGKPDFHLQQVIDDYNIQPGKGIDIGCGTGTNVIWLAKQGFEMTGVDLSPTAMAAAEAKVAAAGIDCRLIAADFLEDEIPGAPFDFVYDRGCFHTFGDDTHRARFALHVAELLSPQGFWHSLIGSTDGPPRDSGPPRRTAGEVVTAVEQHFEILELRSTVFDQGDHRDARAWVMVARKRVFYPG